MRGLFRVWRRIFIALLIPVTALGAGLAAVALLVSMIGAAPGSALLTLLRGAFDDSEGIGYTLFYATDYVFAGLAVALPFQAGLFNIGGEGQAALGGLGATLTLFALRGMPPALILFAAALAATGFAAAWAFVPAWLQARRGSHLVITTIMFNFIAAAMMTWLLSRVLLAPGHSAPETREFAPALWLPTLADLGARIGIDAGGAPLNPSALLALAAAALYWLVLRRTPLGYEIRAVGFNPAAANAAGIAVPRTLMVSVCGGGAFAGLIAVNELFGAQHRLTLDMTAGAGFTGIAVALMGRGRALGIVFAAVLFGALNQGGAALSFEMPNVTHDVVILAEGVAIFVCGALDGAARGHLGRLVQTLRTAPLLRERA
jgi:general nucleoside transport system permease protein